MRIGFRRRHLYQTRFCAKTTSNPRADSRMQFSFSFPMRMSSRYLIWWAESMWCDMIWRCAGASYETAFAWSNSSFCVKHVLIPHACSSVFLRENRPWLYESKKKNRALEFSHNDNDKSPAFIEQFQCRQTRAVDELKFILRPKMHHWLHPPTIFFILLRLHYVQLLLIPTFKKTHEQRRRV